MVHGQQSFAKNDSVAIVSLDASSGVICSFALVIAHTLLLPKQLVYKIGSFCVGIYHKNYFRWGDNSTFGVTFFMLGSSGLDTNFIILSYTKSNTSLFLSPS